MPVTVEQSGDWDAFERELVAMSKLENATIGVGVPDTQHPSPRARTAGLSYRDIAEINEFGTDATKVPIPARPIFGPALRDNEQACLGLLDDALRQFRRKGGSELALKVELDALGRLMVQDVLDKWAEQDIAPLADSTIARKGHDIAWEESGSLLESITPRVTVKLRPAQRFRDGRAAFRDIAGRFAKAGG